MLPSESFGKKARHKIQPYLEDQEKVGLTIHELLKAFLPMMSEELRNEFFYLYWDRFQESNGATVYQFIEWFGPMINLFHGYVEGLEEDFNDEEWELIKMAIDEGADHMDINSLRVIAGYLVRKGRY